MLIDRLHVRRDFSDPKDPVFVGILAWVHSVAEGNDFPKKGKVWRPHCLSSMTNASQPLSNGGRLMVRYGYCQKKFRAWFIFNPAKADLSELGAHLALMNSCGYSDLRKYGLVTKIDVAIDIEDVRFEDYLYLDEALRAGQPGLIKLGTEYLGSSTGARSFCCYDKRSQLLEKTGVHLSKDLLRIEARLIGQEMPLCELAGMKNPFGTLRVMQRQAVLQAQEVSLAGIRDAAALGYSVQQAYGAMPRKDRKAAIAALSQYTPSWWKPDEIWVQFESALSWQSDVESAA